MTLPLPAASGPARPEAVLRQLELVVSRRLDGLLQGDHQGLVPGAGSEPGEGRPYSDGDDVRRIDWNLTARTTVPHVRDAVADRELEVWALVDASASLDFGTALCRKRDLALAAVAAVGFLTARGGNRLGAVVAGPEGITVVAARAGRKPLLALLHGLAGRPTVDGAGPTDLDAAVRSLLRPPRRRGLAVVVSDFLAAPGWERPLTALCSRHQVLAVEVVDPRELELPDVGFLTLVDPETGTRRQVQTARGELRRRYAEAAVAQRAALHRAIRRSGAQHLVLRTDRDWVRDIAGFVLAGRRRAAALSSGSRP